MTKPRKSTRQNPAEKLTGEWVQRADNDFSAVETLVKSDNYPRDVVCYHCQQCAEKYLKAYLTEHAIQFEWTHDLRALQELILDFDPAFENLTKDLDLITDYALDVRYPGRTPTLEEVQDSREAVIRIRTFVRQKLGLDVSPASGSESTSTVS